MPTPPRKAVALAATRAAFKSLEHAAPGLGARWAERLWFTLPPARRPAGPPPAGDPFETEVYGRRIVGETWGRGESVYLVHGWGGSAAQLAAFVPPLVEAGFRVVTYDAPSHGSSDPGPSGARSSTIIEFADTLQAVIETYGRPAGVVAHSLGCLAVATALRAGQRVERAVFVAPMADAASYTATFTRMLGGGERIRTRLAANIEDRVGLAMSSFDIPATALVAATPPLLVIHDRDDKETRLGAAQDIIDGWPDARLIATDGLGHNRILRSPDVVTAAAEFLAQRGQLSASDRLDGPRSVRGLVLGELSPADQG